MLLRLYSLATGLGAPLLNWHLQRRVRRGKEDGARLGERRGRTSLERPAAPVLWVHAASVGESLAALPLIEALLRERPALELLMTTGTVTSAKLMATRLPARARHQFAPLDRAAAWRAFFDHWRPDLGLLVESEIWPNLLLEAERIELPLVLINGRMSKKSAARWRFAGREASRLFRTFALCLARSEADAGRIEALGGRDVRRLGDLKNAAPPLPADAGALAGLSTMIGERPVWLAASTHPGEEEQVLRAHRALRRDHPDLLTLLAPRHPERGGPLADMLRAEGERVARRSLEEPIAPSTGVYLADTLGELGLFYRLAAVAFVGGSLIPHGGQNPLEAARLACPPLFGPHTGNFEETTASLLEAGAALRVRDADDLARTVGSLLADPTARRRIAERARQAGAEQGDVLQRILEALRPLLDRRIGPAAVMDSPVDACA